MSKIKAERNLDEEGMGPLECGRRRYQTKDYEGALLAFKEAVEMSTNHMLLIALDHRAATYEKLKDFKSALRDAREMLKLKPQLVKGYLRVGKVLQLMEQDSLALKMYQRGLEKVKIGGDEDRTILQSMFNKLQRRMAPTPCDPLVKLPTELVEMIFQYLNMRDRVICLSVLKTWKRVLEALPRLWNVLDTTAARRAVTEKALKAYLKRSKYTVETARIAMRPAESGGFNVTKLSYLTRTCKTLQDLEIQGPGTAGDSLVKALPEAENLQRLFVNTNCQVLVGSLLRALDSTKATLREASFLSVETGIRTMVGDWQGPRSDLLTTLRLQAHPSKGYAPLFNLRGLIEAFPNLEVLCVTRWDISSLNSTQMDLTKWSKLKHLNLNDNGLLELPLLPPTLEYLDLGKNLHLASNTNPDGERNNLPLLKYLNCYCTNLRGTTIGALTKPSITAGNLKIFNCGGMDPYFLRTAADVDQTFLASDIMEEFSLADAHLDEDKVLQIIKRYPNLQVLDVSHAKITGSAIREFVEMGIKRVKANNCQGISPDALQYALRKGVQLECRCLLGPVNRFRDITNTEL